MKILCVDDEVKFANLIKSSLEIDGYETFCATSGEIALEIFHKESPDLVISDVNMPEMNGIDLLKKLKSLPNPPEVIMVTANIDTKTAVEAMKLGAFEYVTKPFDMEELSLLAKRIEKTLSIEKRNKQLEGQLQSKFSFESIIGNSSSMQSLFALMEKVKDLNTLVLIRGQSGTGKELVAKALHFQSVRKNEPFIPVNCAAIPENLIESEIFGHKKGAFTGADKDRAGVCEAAGSGTLFLDEIGELPLDLQAKLLRVLQEKEFSPLGSQKTLPLKARIICATNVELEEAVAQGDIREDLFHRLNVFPLYLPPLSERVEDIPILVEHFLNQFKKGSPPLTDETLDHLKSHSWPGNIRELENQMERACIMAGDSPLQKEHFTLFKPSPKKTELIPEEGVNLTEIEKNYLTQALEKAHGNKTKAAEYLGISRRAIYSKMKTHGMM